MGRNRYSLLLVRAGTSRAAKSSSPKSKMMSSKKKSKSCIKWQQKQPPVRPLKEQITIDDVRKIDLRVAKILHAERVPKSKKSLKFIVDLGFEQRTIVSGIGEKMDDPSSSSAKHDRRRQSQAGSPDGHRKPGMILTAETSDTFEFPIFTTLNQAQKSYK